MGNTVWVNIISFLPIMSRHIRFIMSNILMDAKVSIILNCTKNINRVYKLQEFKVTNIIMDGKFEPSKEILKV